MSGTTVNVGTDGALLGLVNPRAIATRVGDDDDWINNPEYFPAMFEAGEAVLWHTDGDGRFAVLVTDDPADFSHLALDGPIEYRYDSPGWALLDGLFRMTEEIPADDPYRVALPAGPLRVRLGQVKGYAPAGSPNYVVHWEPAPANWSPVPLYGPPTLREFMGFWPAPVGAPATYENRHYFARGGTFVPKGPCVLVGPTTTLERLAAADAREVLSEVRGGGIVAFSVPGRDKIRISMTANPLDLAGLRMGPHLEFLLRGTGEMGIAWGAERPRSTRGPAHTWRVRVAPVINGDEPSRDSSRPDVVVFLDEAEAGSAPPQYDRVPELQLP